MALEDTSQPLDYQKRINGIVYGYSNITFSLSPSGNTGIVIPFYEIPDISYNWSNDGQQELGGTSPLPIGFTSGHLTFKGSFTISLEEDTALMNAIVSLSNPPAGVSRTMFDITLDYGPLPAPAGQSRFQRDILYGCLIKDGDNSYSRGNTLMVKHNFVFLNLSRNGVSMI